MKLANKKVVPTIELSELRSGDVVGEFFDGEMYYYIYGFDDVTGDHVFTSLSTGLVWKDNVERKYFYFPNACFDPLGE